MLRSTLAVSLLAALVACASSTESNRPLIPPPIEGAWSSRADGSFLRDLSFSVEMRAADGSGPHGLAHASVRDCPTPTYRYACDTSGIVYAVAIDGATVTVDMSFLNAPLGARLVGTINADGTLSGTLIVNANIERPTPSAIRLSRAR